MDPRELEEAKKVRDALRRGVKLPPGCETEANCKQTCERPSTAAIARQCFAFAKEAGLLPPDVDVAQAERAFQLIEDGTVGSFEELEQCDRRDAFDDQVLLEKCLKIGEAMGVVSSKEAAFIRATGGRGPGGCRGQECKTFCDDPKNRDECFRFTQEHPELIPETDRRHMEEGRGRIADALSQAPPEVKECIQSGVPNIQDIIDGRAMPSETIGNAIQKCFAGSFQSGGFGPGGPDDHGGPGGSGGFGPEPGGFDFPPEVKRCIETSGLSLDFTSPPSPGFEAAIQRCFEKVMGSREDPRGLGPDHEGGPDFHPEQFDGPPDHFDGSRPTDGDQFRRDQEDAIRRHIEEDARYRIEEEVRRNIELEQYRTQCIQRGGHWTGSNCEIPSSSSPSNVSPSTLPPQPTPPLDPAIECGNHGGVWTGAACEFPPQSSNPIVNFFAGVLTLFGVSY
jgi:hypothetical protein